MSRPMPFWKSFSWSRLRGSDNLHPRTFGDSKITVHGTDGQHYGHSKELTIGSLALLVNHYNVSKSLVN